MNPSRPSPIDRRELAALRDKYARMRAMRVAHAAGDERPHEVRVAMADLASRFPGALREIDDLELDEIDRRIERLDDALRGADLEPWIAPIALFHWYARGALTAKRWLNGRRVVTPEVVSSFREEATALAYPLEARAWDVQLSSLAAPPDGRVTGLVYARVAEHLGVTPEEARRLVFGTRRRDRAR